MTVRNFIIEYDALNERNTFSNGDTLTGRIIVEVSKKSKISALTVKAKGKADVAWTESQGEESVTYWDKEKYFSHTQSVIPEEKAYGSVTIEAGRHVFPFAFQLPNQGLPSSFKGVHGKIHYRLHAKLCRPFRASNKAETKFTFVARADYDHSTLIAPQHDSKDKNVIFFASGNISMDIFLPKSGYLQVVNGEIVNNSTRKIVPKYVIYQKQSFFAGGQRTVYTKNILKVKGEPLQSSSRHNLVRALSLPPEISPSINNCRVLKVEYRLKVILDISFTQNPVIKLPFILLSQKYGTSPRAEESGLYPDLDKMHLVD
ncbi:hypothetical protein DNTS_015649 [Danionella cerebrum]|uniref:Arrestin C-terminal-like domain-containing protein n=1 Tax=Danionella cerebrum TaxID=2873325 RepID=A0A553Q6D8_9TELE|nr:hypothetical protein DNTS_015649 [Danionella translucida]